MRTVRARIWICQQMAQVVQSLEGERGMGGTELFDNEQKEEVDKDAWMHGCGCQ